MIDERWIVNSFQGKKKKENHQYQLTEYLKMESLVNFLNFTITHIYTYVLYIIQYIYLTVHVIQIEFYIVNLLLVITY